MSPHAIDVLAYAGAGGLFFGAGAAGADGAETSTVTANIGGTINGANSGTVTVNADDGSSLNALAVGAAVAGGDALGVASGVVKKTSAVTAQVASTSSSPTTIANYNALNVTASEEGTIAAKGIAGAGGLGSAGPSAGAP